MEVVKKIKTGRADYEERKQEKIERYTALSEKAQKESKISYETAKKISDCIPFGQPILVGHHSEKRHRRDLERIGNGYEKAFKLSDKADYYTEKAANLDSSKAISSDNPKAIELLENKIKKLKEKQEFMKSVNAYYRKNKTCKGFGGLTDEQAKKIDNSMKHAYSWETAPFASYKLTNNNATIRTAEKRLASLKRISAIEEQEFCFEGGKIKLNKDDNRIQILFDSIPNEETRKKLKSYGFKWAPSVKAWQRLLNSEGIRCAKWACGLE